MAQEDTWSVDYALRKRREWAKVRPPLVHAHDSRIHFKLDEIEADLKSLAEGIIAVASALDASNDTLVDARLKNLAVMTRRQEIAADVAILREMLGVR